MVRKDTIVVFELVLLLLEYTTVDMYRRWRTASVCNLNDIRSSLSVVAYVAGYCFIYFSSYRTFIHAHIPDA